MRTFYFREELSEFKNLPDSDKDGLANEIEEIGMPLSNGRSVRTNPNKADTDGDGLLDGEEVEVLPKTKRIGVLGKVKDGVGKVIGWFSKKDNVNLPGDSDSKKEIVSISFNSISDPTKKDTDGDNLDDYAEDYIGTSPLSKKNVISFGGATASGTASVAKGAEAKPEAFKRNYFGDWIEMIKDHSWGYIHQQVEKNIDNRYKNDPDLKLENERPIEKVAGLITGRGRADFYSEPKHGVWDVKPSSYAPGLPNRKKGIAQVNKYVEGLKKLAEIDPDNEKGDAEAHPGGDEIKGRTFVTDDKQYEVVYYNSGDGLILYSFKKKRRQNKKNLHLHLNIKKKRKKRNPLHMNHKQLHKIQLFGEERWLI